MFGNQVYDKKSYSIFPTGKPEQFGESTLQKTGNIYNVI